MSASHASAGTGKKGVLETPRGNVHYTIWKNDNPDAPVLVFTHGLLADQTMFPDQIPFFKRDYTVLAWDIPCHGLSRPYSPFSYKAAAVDLKGILDAEHISSVVLLGMSLGGYICQEFYLDYPDVVSAFISIDSTPLGREYLSKSDVFWLRRIEGLSRLFTYRELLHDMAKQNSFTKHTREEAMRIFSQYDKKTMCKLMGHAYTDALAYSDRVEFDCPVLLLLGDHDKTGKVAKYNHMWNERQGYPLVVIENARHLSNIDNPDAVNAAIKGFLEEHVSSTREARR